MLFSSLFVPAALAEAVSDRAWLQAMLDAEAALARAEAQAGLAPSAAAEEIAGCCVADRFDLEVIILDARQAGNPVEPLARALRKIISPEAARYAHLGATSQDILDTASMLIARRALDIIEGDLTKLADGCAALAEQHRYTLMAGRTLLQQALPITFGFKAAGWLSGVTRSYAGLRRLRTDTLTAELGGAVGNLSALGEAGIAVLHEFAALLELSEPDIPWHTERTRIAQIAGALAAAAGAADKIALDVILLAQTETGEVAERSEGRQGGSSTMPQKRNPVGAVLTRACARQAEANVETLLRAMPQEHERAAGVWHTEWQALSSALAFTGGAVGSIASVVSSLEVHPDRMGANLASSGGLVMSERLSFLLAEHVGRSEAADLVRIVADRTQRGGGTFREELLSDPDVTRHLSPQEIDRALDPAGYLGSTQPFIDRALTRYRETFHRSPDRDSAEHDSSIPFGGDL